MNNIENAVSSLFNGDLQADIKDTDISVMHYLPMKNQTMPKTNLRIFLCASQIAVQKIPWWEKEAYSNTVKKQRNHEIFTNEHLGKTNVAIFYQTRQLRRMKLIANTWTNNCRVHIRSNGDTTENQKVVVINNLQSTRTISEIAFYPCSLCDNNVKYDVIFCEHGNCLKWAHRRCAKLTKRELEELTESSSLYFCPKCKDVFSYNGLNHDELQCEVQDISENIYELYPASQHPSERDATIMKNNNVRSFFQWIDNFLVLSST